MKIGLICFTQRGAGLSQRLADCLAAPGREIAQARGFGPDKTDLRAWTGAAFSGLDAAIFIGAAAIAVRMIAPFVSSKVTDPAVLVLDEAGRFVVPILSGHLGGANALAIEVAEKTGAVPVITTATDTRGLFAVDTWAKSQGLSIRNPGRIKTVSAKLLAGEAVRVRSDFPLEGPLPRGVTLAEAECDVRISVHTDAENRALHLIPKCLALGLGCRRDTPVETIADAVYRLLEKHAIDFSALRGVFTIDLKADEPGLLAFCQTRSLPLTAYPAKTLAAVPGDFTASPFVLDTTGVDNVCERAAVLGSGGGALLVHKTAENGVTLALALADPKLSFEGDSKHG